MLGASTILISTPLALGYALRSRTRAADRGWATAAAWAAAIEALALLAALALGAASAFRA